jgi:cAMP-binding proteins - catabolite gene activator and regulatory subunit of cAMP-dependent protein kinases
MKINFLSLRESALFAGISEEEFQIIGECLFVREKKVRKESFVFRSGDSVRYVYLILSGSMHIISEDFWGNRSIIETMNKDVLFGEAYVFAAREQHLVSVIAAEDSVVLEIDPKKLFETCPKACTCHTRMVRNALNIVSEKIVRLTEKLEHVTRRTTREKLLSYLSACSQKAKADAFHIPYSRQQLADFLCVDRSALSHELSKLQREGLVRYQKNQFELLVK